MRLRETITLAFAIPLLVGQAVSSVSKSRPSLAANTLQIHPVPDPDDTDALPASAVLRRCPLNYNFDLSTSLYSINEQLYYFRYGYAAITRIGVFVGDGDYAFGDIKNYAPINRKAVLRNARIIEVNCWYEQGTFISYWHLEYYRQNILADRMDEEPPNPKVLQTITSIDNSPTYDTYCYFLNHYDSSWHYLYSEEIIGSCWTVQVT